MSNYNQTLQSNNIDLQTVLQTLQNKAAGGGGEQATPVISVNASGLITATAGTKSSTYQMAFQPAKTITPKSTSQIAVSSGYYTGGNITVAAIPSTYVQPSYTKTATTYTPKATNQTISAGTYLTGTQTIKGDANLVAANIKSGVSIFGVSGTLVEGSGEGNEFEDAIICRTLSSYTNNRVSFIGDGAFYYHDGLVSVSFPNALKVGAYAFGRCYELNNVYLPSVSSINTGAFEACKSLGKVSFPQAQTLSQYAFRYCTGLYNISIPQVMYLGMDAFSGCGSLQRIVLPKATNIAQYAFENTKLSFLTLPNSSRCGLGGSTAFISTPFTSSQYTPAPRIYVPASLISSYQTATNWAYYSSYFYTIESLNGTTLFSIDGDTYQVEEGMTWGEWCDSQYNIDGYYIENYDVKKGDMVVWEEHDYIGGTVSANGIITNEIHKKTFYLANGDGWEI